MKTVVDRWQYWLVSLYTCITCALLGAVALDIVYAHALSGSPNTTDTAIPASRAADLLLLLVVITFLAGAGAIGAVWSLAPARNLIIASVIFLVGELFIPALFGSILLTIQANSGLQIGSWIRLSGNGLSAALAFVALLKLHPPSP
jgi:hypothetical protein